MYVPVPYHIAAAAIYACILLILALSLYYGRRARRNVKREKVTALRSEEHTSELQSH